MKIKLVLLIELAANVPFKDFALQKESMLGYETNVRNRPPDSPYSPAN